MEDDGMAIGQRIGALMERDRWRIRPLAKKAGVSHEYLRRIVNGTAQNVAGDKLDKIAKALGWSDYHAMMAADTSEATVSKAPPQWRTRGVPTT
jgi:transcriptional regulator with XRE-family HTH domain